MISIVGGELLCALGQGSQKIQALRAGHATIGSMAVRLNDRQVIYPYYSLADTPRLADTSTVDATLDRVVGGLLQKLGLEPSELTNIGIFLGLSSIDSSLARPIEQATISAAASSCQRARVGGGNIVDSLMERFGFQGLSLTYGTACTSSANALMDAAAMLEGDIIDHALVLGLELFSPTTIEGFALMQLLSPDMLRPFDQNRNGMVLGEAVSGVLLSRDDIRPSPWHYLGGKSSCETYSVTGPDPSGGGISRVMTDALADADLPPGAITAIKAHGTASDSMDLAEMRGMTLAFPELPPYFSLKPYIGHTLGGCGVAELVLMIESINAGFIPATINFTTLDREISTAPLQEVMAVTAGHFMLNYFGFGGNNTSFIIEKTAQMTS